MENKDTSKKGSSKKENKDTTFKQGSSKRAATKSSEIVDAPAPQGKAFSSQLKRMSKKPLKYNPEDVMVIAVDMNQEQFDYAIDMAKEALGKFKKEEEPSMAKYISRCDRNRSWTRKEFFQTDLS